MVFKDYYKILDLDTLTYDQEKIKEAYKKQAKKYHPDINKNISNEFFNDIYESYQVLSNPNKKRAYDRLWLSYIARDKKENKTYEHKRRNITIEQELRNLFFGEKFLNNMVQKKHEQDLASGKKTKAKNIVIDLDLSIEEAFFGTKKEITFRNLDNTEKTILLTIPSGIRTGDVLSINNFEKASDFLDQTNVLVNINIKDSNNLKLKNMDLHYNISVYPWDFALGKKLTFNILNEDISVFIPKHTFKSFSYKLPQKGFKDKNGFRGNLFISVDLKLPNNFAETDIEIYEKMKENFENNIN